MLMHPTLDQLHALGLHGMAKGFKDLMASAEARSLDHADWLGLLLEHEATLRAPTEINASTWLSSSQGKAGPVDAFISVGTLRRQKRFEARSKAARLRQAASVEDVDYRSPRGLDRTLFLKLATCEWIRNKHNLVLTGPCGVGKSWLACALGQKACREDLPVLYHRVPRLFTALALARGDGRYAKLMASIGRAKLLILDDWGPETLNPEQARDLLEIVEDRMDKGSILVTSQIPVDRWHDLIGNSTIADAILDRIIHNAYRVTLTGESLRKQRAAELV